MAIPSRLTLAMQSLLYDENSPNARHGEYKGLSGGYSCLLSDNGKNFVAPQLPDKPRSRYHRVDLQYI